MEETATLGENWYKVKIKKRKTMAVLTLTAAIEDETVALQSESFFDKRKKTKRIGPRCDLPADRSIKKDAKKIH